jgi:hypothetical protein
MQWSGSLEGSISTLTKEYGGNVHEGGIVTITSPSVSDNPKYALKNVADLTSDSFFLSKDVPGQSVCWDCHEMGIGPTNCTIRAWDPKSWVLEVSLDGASWTVIDRRTNNRDFKKDS